MDAQPLHLALAENEVDRVAVPAARYHFEFAVRETVRLPEYAGSTIRGAFGKALRRTACMTHQPDCRQCPLYRSCAYTAVFEAPPPEDHVLQKFSQIPNAYVIEPPHWGRQVLEAGEPLSFSVVLYGRVRNHLALIIYALQRAFARNVGHGRADLVSVSLIRSEGEQLTVYVPTDPCVRNHENDTVLNIPSAGPLTLRINTPLRLQQNGTPLGPERISAHAFLMTLLRRVSLLEEFQNGHRLDLDFTALSLEAGSLALQKDLGWKDWTRFSSRQNQTMSLGGVVGTMTFSELSPIFRILVSVGQLTHLGKNATFGLGHYSVESHPD